MSAARCLVSLAYGQRQLLSELVGYWQLIRNTQWFARGSAIDVIDAVLADFKDEYTGKAFSGGDVCSAVNQKDVVAFDWRHTKRCKERVFFVAARTLSRETAIVGQHTLDDELSFCQGQLIVCTGKRAGEFCCYGCLFICAPVLRTKLQAKNGNGKRKQRDGDDSCCGNDFQLFRWRGRDVRMEGLVHMCPL